MKNYFLIFFCALTVLLPSCRSKTCISQFDLQSQQIDTTYLNKNLFAISGMDTIQLNLIEPVEIRLKDTAIYGIEGVHHCEIGMQLSYQFRYKNELNFISLSFLGDENKKGYFNYVLNINVLDEVSISTQKFYEIDTSLKFQKNNCWDCFIETMQLENGYIKSFTDTSGVLWNIEIQK